MLGAIMLLLMNDFVTKLTSHYGLVLGVVILLFALGLRKGVLDYLADIWHDRKTTASADAARQTPAAPAQPRPAGE
jgi:branched-chain amino acid transport system permease protein